MKQLMKKIKIEYIIKVKTGLHIGGNVDNVEIGGIDRPVIKLALLDNQPFIPGSSLKGKIRSLLEQANGITIPGEKGKDENRGKAIMNLFGINEKDSNTPSEKRENQPSKLIVRDAMLTKNSIELFKERKDYLDMPYTEGKWENSINRITGKAANPRQTERIPAGAEFKSEFIINVWDTDGDGTTLVNLLKDGIKLLSEDYLGGSGSRGYGQVEFESCHQECVWEFNSQNNKQ